MIETENALVLRSKYRVEMSQILKILVVAGIAFFVLCILCLRPVPALTKYNAIIDQPIIEEIFEAGDKDIVFTDKHSDKAYYINRGLEKDLSIVSLQARLLNKRVSITYPRHWTLLDPGGKVKHLSKLEIEGEVIYDESRRDE